MTIDSLGTDNPKQVFTNIFKRNWWNNNESRSGWGAELKRTETIRAELHDFVQRHSIQSLLDAPCGDFHWMKLLMWEKIPARRWNLIYTMFRLSLTDT